MASNPATGLIVVTGPESSGKSALARWLARTRSAALVDEYAREYFESRPPGRYDGSDLLAIAQAQQAAEARAVRLARPGQCVIADTDHTVVEIWWSERLGASTAPLDALRQRAPRPRAYLLCRPDLPWEPDPLRENPTDRDRLFQRYLALLLQRGERFRVVWGTGAERLRRGSAGFEALRG